MPRGRAEALRARVGAEAAANEKAHVPEDQLGKPALFSARPLSVPLQKAERQVILKQFFKCK